MNRIEFNRTWSNLHGGVEIQGAVSLWLRISYVIARALAFLRVTPNVITTLGLLSAIAIYFTSYTSQLFFLVIFSLICDGVDGSLAIYRNRASRGGELYDAVADRISEAFWLMGATFVGVPVRWAIAIWILASTQEYARARLASLGYTEIGAVTPAERPIRAIFVVLVTLSYWLGYEYATQMAIAFTALQAISVLIVMRMARSILR
ncbi:MAG: CDP-alcohol phosphatidyltransferase family protein [Candidatus Planktophila sp.]